MRRGLPSIILILTGLALTAFLMGPAFAQQNLLPFLINTGAADDITEKKWDYIFRLNPPVSEYASGLETFLAEVVKPKTAVILHENTMFGTKGPKPFKRPARGWGSRC